jgi:prepilin-type N-terminal cleavage/methylation domain-containing protein
MTRRAGFTLVEMLLVVFILAAVAATAVSVVEETDDQLRYEDSKARLTLLRAAVAGDETAAGRAAPRGFVADVGRLPRSVAELIQAPDELSPPSGVGLYDGATGFGWRGPYLPLPPREASAAPSFPDGFGTAGGAPDYGWTLSTTPAPAVVGATDLTLRSGAGADGLAPAVTVRSDDVFVDVGAVVVRVVFDDGAIASGLETAIGVRTDGTVYGAAQPAPAVPATVDDLPGLPGYSAVDFALPAARVPWGLRTLRLVTTPDDGGTFVGFGVGTPGRLLLLPRASLPRVELSWRVP